MASFDITNVSAQNIADFANQSLTSDPSLSAIKNFVANDIFASDNGQSERLSPENIDFSEVATIYFLVKTLQAARTAETGFGTGMSALTILAAQEDLPSSLHISIDPYGLQDKRGELACDFISRKYGQRFRRVREPSELALPSLVSQSGHETFDFMLIDGNHTFDGTLVDFFFFDKLCKVGGCIAIDDSSFPAIETTVNYVRSNFENYRFAEFGASLAVFQKTAPDKRTWDHFVPFEVPQRHNWTPRS